MLVFPDGEFAYRVKRRGLQGRSGYGVEGGEVTDLNSHLPVRQIKRLET